MTDFQNLSLFFFHNIFYPLYKSKTKPDESDDGTKKENRKAVTTKQLSVYNKEKTDNDISPDRIRNTYLKELIDSGFIDDEVSQIHKGKHIYYPLIESTTTNTSPNSSQEESDKSSTLNRMNAIIGPILTIHKNLKRFMK